MKKIFVRQIAHKYFFTALIFLAMFVSIAAMVGAHGDENHALGELTASFFHYGSLGFPAWTYYVEIVEHIAMFLVVMAAALVYLVAYKKEAGKSLGIVIAGFILLAVAELLTIAHHFLIHPLGIFNAVVNHFLTLIGFVLLAYGIFMMLKNKNV